MDEKEYAKTPRQTSLTEIVSAFSLLLDIAENRRWEHGRRTAYISFQIAKEINEKDEDFLYKIFHAALLHDIGFACCVDECNLVTMHNNPQLAMLHVVKGEEILQKMPFLSSIVNLVKYHHERYDGKGPYGLSNDKIPLGSQIINLADTVELHFNTKKDSLQEREKVISVVSENSGKMFDPYLVEIFIKLANKDSFWLDLYKTNFEFVFNTTASQAIHKNSVKLNKDDIRKLAEAFATIIDHKSPFTYYHSRGVANWSENIGKCLGIKGDMFFNLSIASYLHDLGKIAIPNIILDKPGKLNNEEFMVIKKHPYFTFLVLRQISGWEHIASLAANHHEKLKGNGYPNGKNSHELTTLDQIITVSDIYQALIEERPYRKAMTKEVAFKILDEMAENGDINKELVNILKEIG